MTGRLSRLFIGGLSHEKASKSCDACTVGEYKIISTLHNVDYRLSRKVGISENY